MDGQEQDKPLPGFDDRAPKDRYCDLILTGGVTSAIAYPAVAFGLGQVYRFNAIGGASSGSGIAAVAAAAEYRRRHGSADGFQTMAERTLELANERSGRTNLSRLFQPLYRQRRLFKAILRFVALPGHSIWTLVIDAAKAYWWVILLGVIEGLAIILFAHPWTVPGWQGHQVLSLSIALLVFFLVLPLLFVGLAIWDDVVALGKDDFGLCDGLSQSGGEAHPPLTVWLHALIQNAAGRPADGVPLTFADLHNAPASPRETRGDLSEGGAKSIRLEVVAANVTVGEPVRFPRTKENAPLYFRPAEMRRLFPESVVAHMCQNSEPYDGGLLVKERDGTTHAAVTDENDPLILRSLPLDQLPLIVTVRMSVSFPVLLAAVPLWREDPESKLVRRCLMMDGGICSNFPIHLFDSLVPAWPTFGISLYDLDPQTYLGPVPIRVDLPPMHTMGASPLWNAFNESKSASSRLIGLVGGLLATTKDWSDSVQARRPGVRERVVRVGLPSGIGGLNILMNKGAIQKLASSGQEAARQLLQRYSGATAPTGQSIGWDEHRWIRLNLLCESMAQALNGMAQAAETSRHATPLRELIQRSTETPPLQEGGAKDQLLRTDQAAALEGALAALAQAERALAAARTGQPYHPHPPVEIHVRSPM